jgi:hypothetical protein
MHLREDELEADAGDEDGDGQAEEPGREGAEEGDEERAGSGGVDGGGVHV